MFDNWDKDAKGNYNVNPLTGSSTMLFETAIGLRLEHLVDGDSFLKPSGFVQLIVTPVQAQELAAALLKAADKILNAKPTGKPS
jgi:hypothetical protein